MNSDISMKIICTFLLMLIAGCDTPLSPIDDDEDPEVEDPVVIDPIPTCLTYEQGDELFPLSTGNYWVYYAWRLSPTLDYVYRDEITREIVVPCDGGQFTAYGWQRFLHLDNTPLLPGVHWLIANSNDGLYAAGGMSESDTFFVASPLYIESDEDNSWYSSLVSFNIAGGYFHATDSVKYELVETHATFQTEHGLFEDCIVFRFEEKTHDDMVFHWYHYIYVKPGIGIVGRQTLDILFAEDPDDKDLRVVGEWTLVEYDLN